MATNDIPLVDISRGRGHAPTVRRVEAACRDVGFMYAGGHGISPEVVDAIRAAVVGYFAKPLEDKLRDCITRDNYRGYIPMGFFSPNAGAGEADRYEGYKLHFETAPTDPIRDLCDLYGPNKWPVAPTGMMDAVLTYWQSCDRVADALLGMLAEIMGVDPAEFLGLFEKPLTNMTLLHYPPQGPDETGFGIHPHKDTDALTILAPDRVGGLMVKKRDGGEWIEARAPGDALVVNIGDLLELWSGGYFVSTPHKVVNRSGAERFSFPYFAVPRYDTVVEPLVKPKPGFTRTSVHVGDVSKEVWRTNWRDSAPAAAGYDLGTLPD